MCVSLLAEAKGSRLERMVPLNMTGSCVVANEEGACMHVCLCECACVCVSVCFDHAKQCVAIENI
jgi:hypothetical protein